MILNRNDVAVKNLKFFVAMLLRMTRAITVLVALNYINQAFFLRGSSISIPVMNVQCLTGMLAKHDPAAAAGRGEGGQSSFGAHGNLARSGGSP